MSALAVLFPGQGSQEVNMGRDFAEKNSDIMGLWKTAERLSGHALREIYWDGDVGAMAQTEYLQPALTVVNLSVWMLLSKKCTPFCTAGHSLGELSALAAAGVLSFEHVLELVSLRGRLMSAADPNGMGTMAAVVRLSLQDVEACIAESKQESGEVLVMANYNTPAQYVASGTKKAIATLVEKVKARKGRALPLPVSGAFHSPLLAEAAKEMEKAIRILPKTAWNTAKFSVYSNTTGKGTVEADILREELCKQMTSSVQWVQTVQNMFASGARHFVECGPKQVLSRMVEPILAEVLAEMPVAEAISAKMPSAVPVNEAPFYKVTSVNNQESFVTFG